MKKLCKRIGTGVLTLCLILGVLPVGTRAAMVDGSDYLTQQLYLGDSLMLHLRGNTDYPYAENAEATVSFADKMDNYRLEDLTVCEDGQRELILDLAAAQMTEDIDLNIKVGSVEVLDETYSIREYIRTLLNGRYSYETKALCYELLNYGAWAQRYFSHRTDDLADAGYTLTAGTSIPTQYPAMKVSGKVSGLQYYGASVRFTAKLAVRFYFVTDSDISGYTFTVNETSYKPEQKDGMYFIEVPGINPQDMDSPLNVAVTDGSSTMSFAYITTDFFVRSHYKSTDETYRNLLTAAYSYFMAAKKFASIGKVGDLDITYQSGSSKSIQVATSLPSDTPIADFTLSDHNCDVNEDANLYQRASKIQMENADGRILLTFCFDSDFTAGQTYTLPKNAVFGFADGKQYALTQDYIFVFDGSSWSAVRPEGDFRAGIGFEELGNTLRFTGQGLSEGDGTLTRMAYSDLKIATPADGGSYALRLSHTNNDPVFRIQFGRELEARTQLTFMAYNPGTRSNFTVSDSGVVTDNVFSKVWTKLTILLPEKAEYIDLCWNTNGSGGMVYMDNFQVVEPELSANLLLGFESYAELTGTKPAVGNMLGRMEINKDVNFISQGNASLKVSPQGDYSKPGSHPYIKLDLLDTTAKFNDLSEFKSISFDVYNAESQKLNIAVCILTGEDYESYQTTHRQSFELAPNSWTTCTYDLSYVGIVDTYDLSNVRYLRLEFLQHKNSKDDVPNVLYIDNLHANAYASGEGPVAVQYDINTGIDFETPGQEYIFTSRSIPNQDADIERIRYYSNGTVAAPSGGGSYGVRLRHESNYWPTFRLYFGEELPAGTEITFMAYGRILNGSSLYNQCIFEYSTGGDATELFDCGKWTQVYLTVPKKASYIDLFWNYDRASITSPNVYGEVYIDNVIVERPEPDGDILEGYGFEERGNAERFTGQGTANDATINRMSYSILGVDAPANGGSHALMLTHQSSMTPVFRINFGRKLAAGTTITFDAYAVLKSGYLYPKKNVFKYADGTNASDSFDFKVWKTVSITLKEESDHIDLTWSFKGSFGSAVCELYLDNIKATEPEILPVGDFMAGVDFETSGNEKLFSGVGGNEAWRDATLQKIAYADAGVSAPANGGNYALKLTCASSQWPTFRINFGKTLKAGTTITFDAYTNDNSGIRSTVSIFEYLSGGEATVQYYHGSWNTLTITLASDCDYIDLMCNMDRWNELGSANLEVYMDNFKAADSTEPEEPAEPEKPTDSVGDFLTGVDFEIAGDEQSFGAVGGNDAWRDATLERVQFDGDYALKLTCGSSQWPVFRISFGKTLKAGTTITFDAYTNDTSGIRNTVSIFEYVSGGEATKQYYHGSWNTLTITLASDCDHIDLMCNMDRWSEPGPANIEVYMDNFKAVEPEEPAGAVGDLTQGVGFETAGNELLFTGTGKNTDATVERVTYAALGIEAPANGGTYALKLSHTSNAYPTFRINFGKTLKKGTTIIFDGYAITDGSAISLMNSAWTQAAYLPANAWRTNLTWEITLQEDCSYIDMLWECRGASKIASSIIIDNIKAV